MRKRRTEPMIEIKTADEFCERVKKKERVSRLDVEIRFEWNAEASAKLGAVLANLTGANLTGADLTWANLTRADLTWAEGTFTFNFGVKLEVKKED
jgi:hypothetical protein